MKRFFTCVFILALCLVVFPTTFPTGSVGMTKPTLTADCNVNQNASAYDKSILLHKIGNGHIKIIRNNTASEQISEINCLSDLEDLTDCIVKGAFYGDSREDLQFGSGDQVYFGNTITSFKITEVYKGDLKPGDSIEIVEPYYIDNEGNLQIEFNGLPSLKDQEYLLFLCKDKVHGRFDGMYGSLLYETGRYPVVDTSIRAFDIGHMSNTAFGIDNTAKDEYVDFYKIMYDAVIEKYMN